jgi:hypothetical protein
MRFPNFLRRTIPVCTVWIVLLSTAFAEPVATAIQAEQFQQAGIGVESIKQPGLITILALSIAASILVRRRRSRQ